MDQSKFDDILRSFMELPESHPLEGSEWDSLVQLSIIMEIEKFKPGFSQEVPELLQIVKYDDFVKLAKENNIII